MKVNVNHTRKFYAILLLVVLTKMCILAIKVYIGFVFVITIIINRVMVVINIVMAMLMIVMT